MYTRGHEPWRPSLNSAYYFTSVRKPLLIPKFFSSCAPAAHSVYFLWDGSRPDILVPAQGCQGLLTLSSLAPKPFSIPMEKQQLDFDTSGMSSSPVDQPISFLLQQSSFWKSCFEAFPLMCAEGRDYWGACMDTDIVVSCDFLGKWSSHARKVLLWWELSMLWEKKKKNPVISRLEMALWPLVWLTLCCFHFQVPTWALLVTGIPIRACFGKGDKYERAPERMPFLLLLNYSSAAGP